MRHIEWHLVFLELLGDIEHRTRLQQGALNPELGQYPDRGSAAGAGTDHHHVKNFWAALYLWHPVILSPLEQRRLALVAAVGPRRRAPRQHRSRVILRFPD